ncbi:MAG: hypothetical protein IJP89_09650 [Synergistaceae bacterium]|nr:hypothetical protein [Synergistaceae bacterium]
MIGEHRYYPDGFKALAKWAGFQVINATVGGVPSMSAPKETVFQRTHRNSRALFKMLLKRLLPRTYVALKKVKSLSTL